jgi:hypothetical protein
MIPSAVGAALEDLDAERSNFLLGNIKCHCPSLCPGEKFKLA